MGNLNTSLQTKHEPVASQLVQQGKALDHISFQSDLPITSQRQRWASSHCFPTTAAGWQDWQPLWAEICYSPSLEPFSLALVNPGNKHELVAPRCIFKADKPKDSDSDQRTTDVNQCALIYSSWGFGSGRQAVVDGIVKVKLQTEWGPPHLLCTILGCEHWFPQSKASWSARCKCCLEFISIWKLTALYFSAVNQKHAH